jgi:hypothetical protein
VANGDDPSGFEAKSQGMYIANEKIGSLRFSTRKKDTGDEISGKFLTANINDKLTDIRDYANVAMKKKRDDPTKIDHFNWYQMFVITAGGNTVSGECASLPYFGLDLAASYRMVIGTGRILLPGVPFADPPAGGTSQLWFTRGWRDFCTPVWEKKDNPADYLPWYLPSTVAKRRMDGDSIFFSDEPRQAPLTTINFKVWLVGVDKAEANPVFFGGIEWSWSRPLPWINPKSPSRKQPTLPPLGKLLGAIKLGDWLTQPPPVAVFQRTLEGMEHTGSMVPSAAPVVLRGR